MTELSAIRPQRRNANKHSPRGMTALEQSVQTDGWIGAITVAADGETFDGSARIETAAATGFDDPIVVESDGTRPVVVKRTDIPTADDVRAVRLGIAANRVAQLNLDWDTDVLTSLAADGIDLSPFWTKDEIAALLVQDVVPGDGGDDFDTTPADGPTLVQPGQLWHLGEHRLLCGDSTKAEDVARLMDGERADMVLTDPPYGMRLDADFSGMRNHLDFAQEKGIKNGRKYDNVTGDHADFDASIVAVHFRDVQEQFWFGADYYASTLGDTQHTGAWLVWDKRLDESADKMYGSCFELIWSRQKHKRDILRCKWAGIFGTEHEPQRGREHPNQKPVRLFEELMTRYATAGATIVDLYAGSGVLVAACQRTGRKARVIEIEPKYCDVILRRFTAETGIAPVLVAS